MKIWNDLVATALVGTGKTAALPAVEGGEGVGGFVGEIGAAGAGAEGGLEDALLKRAGTLALWRRNARQAETVAPAPKPPAEPETAAFITPAAASHLVQMLGGIHAPVLPEWLRLAGERSLVIPPELLPAALELARKSPKLREAFHALLGVRGRWLAEQNPDWSAPPSTAEVSDWETGTPTDRVAYLRRLRGEQPEEALKRLEEVWKAEPADMRKRFVEVIAEAVKPGDEAFLERALDDKSKETKRAAAEALSLLASSALNARMAERGEKLCQFTPGGLIKPAKLDFEVPAEIDAAMLRDGIEVKAYSQTKKLGEKAAGLMLILAGIPVQVWRTKTGMKTEALVKAGAASEWSLAILSGWAAAAKRFADVEMALALLSQNDDCEVMVNAEELMRVLPETERARWVSEMIRQKQFVLGSDKQRSALFGVALESFDEHWPSGLAEMVLKQMCALVEGKDMDWSTAYSFQRIALSLPPIFLEGEDLGWEPSEGNRGTVDKFFEVLRFRKEIRKALDTKIKEL